MILSRSAVRGSRRHLLDWVELPSFRAELNGMLEPTGASVGAEGVWMPRGWDAPREARLETFGPRALPGALEWPELTSWWVRHPMRGNTPNWDFAASCTVGGRRGLVLVEAKAHSFELGEAGKSLRSDASTRSRENHGRIVAAIDEARAALEGVVPGVHISAKRCYQLANRIAHAWWLAAQGVPTVLLYLGFLGDDRMGDLGVPLEDGDHWRKWFSVHSAGILPHDFVDRWIDCGKAPLWFGLRSRAMPVGYGPRLPTPHP